MAASSKSRMTVGTISSMFGVAKSKGPRLANRGCGEYTRSVRGVQYGDVSRENNGPPNVRGIQGSPPTLSHADTAGGL